MMAGGIKPSDIAYAAYEAGRATAAAEIAWLRTALMSIALWDESDVNYQGPGSEAEMKQIAWAHLGMYTPPESAEADGPVEEF